jgi:hypothetical protein
MIRFAQPPFLNDPYETNPVITGSDITDGNWEKISRIECERNGLNYDDFKHLNDRKVRDEMFPAMLQLMKTYMHHCTGVLSLSETHDNALMWSHYCYNHKGFVIQFDADHPFFSSNQKEYIIEHVSKVLYSDKRPNITLQKLTMQDLE